MTFSASSMEAWCRYVVEIVPSEEDLERTPSRRQLARPAVEESFLDQMILMPPVEADRVETWLSAMVWSTSARKEVARECFCALKAFRLASAALSFLTGLLHGLLRGDSDGERSS